MGVYIKAFEGTRCLIGHRKDVTPHNACSGHVSHEAKNLKRVGKKILPLSFLKPSQT